MARHQLRIPRKRPRANVKVPPTRVHTVKRESEKVGIPHEDGVIEFRRPEYRFCPRCGATLEPRAEHDVAHPARPVVRPTCPNCGFIAYYNPVPAVGGVIMSDDHVLLVKRAFPPKEGQWSLPAGFMEFGERQLDALAREVREEVGLEIFSATLLSVEDASDDPRTHALLIAFLVDEWQGEPRPGDDASAVEWWPIVSPPPDMAWRNHVRVLAKAREWLGL